MQNRMKKAAAAICVGAMTFTAVPAFAAEIPVTYQHESGITPYYQNIVYLSADLYISGGTAEVDCYVMGDASKATKAKVVAELQEKNGSSWSTIATWTDTQNDYMASVYKSKTVTRGKTYRIKLTGTVWQDGKSESDTMYGGEKTA